MTYLSGEIPQMALFDTARVGPVATAAPTAEALRQPAAAVIQRCYRWLETAVPLLPEAAALAPILVTAVQQYAARQYPACLQQVNVVALAVQQLRVAVPALPPL